MICPNGNGFCNCEVTTRRLCTISPPKPSIEDIERLAGDVSLALSALMAAIKAYGEG